MANPEHVELVRKGADAIRDWRAENPQEPLDLSHAELPGIQLAAAPLGAVDLSHSSLVEGNLSEADLRGANVTGADLRGADLSGVTGHALQAGGADLRRAIFTKADLRAAQFERADLRAAVMDQTDLRAANFHEADARRGNFQHTDFRRADLSEANFQDGFLPEAHFGECRLINTNFTRTSLYGADFDEAKTSGVLWNDVDLAETRNLKTIVHWGPSSVGVDTIYQSRGNLPAEFLRGCGINESFIANMASLAQKSLHFHSVLLVHAEEDREQVALLEAALQKRGVRCWRDAITAEANRDLELYRYRRGQKLVFCVSQNWFTKQTANQTLQTAQMLEDKISREQGLSVRNWFTADLDGVLIGEHGSEWKLAHKKRMTGQFLPEFSHNGEFEYQLEALVNVLTAQLGVDDQASLVDQALTQIRQLIGTKNRLQEGYRRLLRNDGAKNQWFDYRGHQRRSYHIRQLERGRSMEWETAPVVFERGQDFCYFCFAGAMGAQNRPPGLGFYLLVNGEPAVPFNLARDDRAWHSADHSVTLFYSPHWLSRDDSSGFFYVAILRDRLRAGHSARLGVQVRGQDSPRWFALFPERQAVLCQAEMDKI